MEVPELADSVTAGRSLSVVDALAVEMYASLVADLRAAQELLATHGVVVEGVEHPAVSVAVKCSRELRGWVERRPDLFGAAATPAKASGRARFETGLRAVP